MASYSVLKGDFVVKYPNEDDGSVESMEIPFVTYLHPIVVYKMNLVAESKLVLLFITLEYEHS
jgi:hypothetical protein